MADTQECDSAFIARLIHLAVDQNEKQFALQ
jgi:hypothetical protein